MKSDVAPIQSAIDKTGGFYQYVMHKDIPWKSSRSAIAGWYMREGRGLHVQLVANDTNSYVNTVVQIATDRELAYNIRVRLLEIVDDNDPWSDEDTLERSYRTQTPLDIKGTLDHKDLPRRKDDGMPDCGYCVDDVAAFIHRVGAPWSVSREERTLYFASREKNKQVGKGRNRRARRRKRSGDGDDGSDGSDKHMYMYSHDDAREDHEESVWEGLGSVQTE
jgi:hypothetical protein